MIVTNDKRSIRLRWDPVLAADHYKVAVYDDTDSANPSLIADNLLANGPEFEWLPDDFDSHGYPPTRDLLFRVWSVNRLSMLSDDYAEIGVHNPPPAGAPIHELFVYPNKIQVVFTEPGGLDYHEYLIWASTTPGFTPDAGTLVYRGRDTSVVFSDLPYNKTYYYRVGIRDFWGPDSDAAMSAEKSVTTVGPGGETGTRAAISVAWNQVPGADHYHILAYDNTDPANPVLVWEGDTRNTFLNYTPRTLDGLGVERFRDFKLEGWAVDANGTNIGGITVVTYSEPAPPVPSIGLHTSPGVITVSIGNLAFDHEGFILWASRTPGFPVDDTTKVFHGRGNSVTFSNLVPGDTWYFRVAAYDHWGIKNLNVSPEQSVMVQGSETFYQDPATGRANLGLGNAATRNVGSGSGEVAAGNHTHSSISTTFTTTDGKTVTVTNGIITSVA